MSGVKTAHVRPNPTRELQRVLGPVLAQLETLKSSYTKNSQGVNRKRLTDARSKLSQHDKDLKEYRVRGEARQKTFDAVSQSKPLLSKCEDLQSALPQVQLLASHIDTINQVISQGNLSQQSSCHSKAQRLISQFSNANRDISELKSLQAQLIYCLNISNLSTQNTTSMNNKTSNMVSDERTKLLEAERLRQTQFRHLSHGLLSSLNQEALLTDNFSEAMKQLGNFNTGHHVQLLSKAQRLLQAHTLSEQTLEEAKRVIESAASLRIDAEGQAQANLELIKERDLVAAHLADHLSQLNYDDADVYLTDEEKTGELSNLVIYAQNPSGRGNVRIELGIEGSIKLEIDGVPEGEEVICTSLLEGFQEASRRAEMEFTIDDYGRAARALNQTPHERIKQHERMRERSK
jgi:hypothetical protein